MTKTTLTVPELQATITKLEQQREQLKQTVKKHIVAQLKSTYKITDLGDDYFIARIEIVPEAEGSNKFVPRVMVNGEIAYKAGSFMTPEQLVEETKLNKVYSTYFDAGKNGASGSDPNQRASGGSGNGFVNSSDRDAIGANLEDIASGKVKVV